MVEDFHQCSHLRAHFRQRQCQKRPVRTVKMALFSLKLGSFWVCLGSIWVRFWPCAARKIIACCLNSDTWQKTKLGSFRQFACLRKTPRLEGGESCSRAGGRGDAGPAGNLSFCNIEGSVFHGQRMLEHFQQCSRGARRGTLGGKGEFPRLGLWCRFLLKRFF